LHDVTTCDVSRKVIVDVTAAAELVTSVAATIVSVLRSAHVIACVTDEQTDCSHITCTEISSENNRLKPWNRFKQLLLKVSTKS